MLAGRLGKFRIRKVTDVAVIRSAVKWMRILFEREQSPYAKS
jgi:hypothetical protein